MGLENETEDTHNGAMLNKKKRSYTSRGMQGAQTRLQYGLFFFLIAVQQSHIR